MKMEGMTDKRKKAKKKKEGRGNVVEYDIRKV